MRVVVAISAAGASPALHLVGKTSLRSQSGHFSTFDAVVGPGEDAVEELGGLLPALAGGEDVTVIATGCGSAKFGAAFPGLMRRVVGLGGAPNSIRLAQFVEGRPVLLWQTEEVEDSQQAVADVCGALEGRHPHVHVVCEVVLATEAVFTLAVLEDNLSAPPATRAAFVAVSNCVALASNPHSPDVPFDANPLSKLLRPALSRAPHQHHTFVLGCVTADTVALTASLRTLRFCSRAHKLRQKQEPLAFPKPLAEEPTKAPSPSPTLSFASSESDGPSPPVESPEVAPPPPMPAPSQPKPPVTSPAMRRLQALRQQPLPTEAQFAVPRRPPTLRVPRPPTTAPTFGGSALPALSIPPTPPPPPATSAAGVPASPTSPRYRKSAVLLHSPPGTDNSPTLVPMSPLKMRRNLILMRERACKAAAGPRRPGELLKVECPRRLRAMAPVPAITLHPSVFGPVSPVRRRNTPSSPLRRRRQFASPKKWQSAE